MLFQLGWFACVIGAANHQVFLACCHYLTLSGYPYCPLQSAIFGDESIIQGICIWSKC
ncbi:hypothetical protein [Polynucleobacter necessarius]|uniref:hypothetical protein n=1 Tax=Polynucleobacter necessarius TaxID=576610 RepID=UPI0039E2EE3B